jgi:hypothetical protein
MERSGMNKLLIEIQMPVVWLKMDFSLFVDGSLDFKQFTG